MQIYKGTGLLVILCCELCLSIKVPSHWKGSGKSAVKNEYIKPLDNNKSQNVQTLQQAQSIPVEYFQYTAHKPKFATDIAAFHGVKNPDQHYKAYPVKPYTVQKKPILGIHHMLNEDKSLYRPYQNYVQKLEEPQNYVQPKVSGYEIYHPYKYEEPAFRSLYKDSTLNKIRNDLENNKNRLHSYQEEVGKANIADAEHLESVEKTESKLFPHKNIPATYEIHRPERRPVYYRAPLRNGNRDDFLNRRLKHPLNQHSKIRPLHYKPLKNHIQNLRQQHAMKYNDKENEYPQIQLHENTSDIEEGYDIFEKGKQKYTNLRNNVDESINKAIQENKPMVYENLEFLPNESEAINEDDEFVPVKNYAQVRKTETVKHLPRKAAFEDADTYEDVINAPRLREAIKSTKAQVVYSEEGYEDSAYDHAGEQKHASDHEGHGGFLKETANSGGLYKIPTALGNYQDGSGSEYRDKIEHKENWKSNVEDHDNETEVEDYSDNEHHESVEADTYDNTNQQKFYRSKREHEKDQIVQNITNTNHNRSLAVNKTNNSQRDHDLDQREINFEVPTINLSTTYLSEDEILKIAPRKVISKENFAKEKYPYYLKNLKAIHKHSPLRYAENFKLIPKKTNGGTEFYDSRAILECPEIEDNIDPIPENLKQGENPTENENSDDDSHLDSDDTQTTKQARLEGLGDKIDCLKAKYFGENPLDSPFFKEEIISNPEPITVPKLSIFRHLKENAKESKIQDIIVLPPNLKESTKTGTFTLFDKLITNHSPRKKSLYKTNNESETHSLIPNALSAKNGIAQIHTYTDILASIKSDLRNPILPTSLTNTYKDTSNLTYNFFQNKEAVTKLPAILRKKRGVPFMYEPYKIIKDSQYQDSKKTTTSSNISPLIRQLQTSRVVDRVPKSNLEVNKPSRGSRTYVDIGKNDRFNSNINPTIVDISVDHRRGEPRYELRYNNHKTEYTPVQNKRVMSRVDYETLTTTEKTDVENTPVSLRPNRGQQRFQYSATTIQPAYDMLTYLSQPNNVQKAAASNSITKTVSSMKPPTIFEEVKNASDDLNSESEESYEDDEDDEDEGEEEEKNDDITTTSTTTTPKPLFRKKTKVSTTTENVQQHITEAPPERLQLVTRFRNQEPNDTPEKVFLSDEDHFDNPKFKEKKKKTLESTSVTDIQKYGNDDDESGKEEKEIDTLIGVKQNMNDYMPVYEKEEQNKEKHSEQIKESEEEEDEDNSENDDTEESESDEDYEDDDDEEGDDTEEEPDYSEIKFTTAIPTKLTLPKTTELPPPTIAAKTKPIITRKQIEINKEVQGNKSLPHITEFKHDMKEVEIIKEMAMPAKKKQKEKPLELYKDDNLAKDVNKLEDVEVFSEGVDLDQAPKHGGNFRRAHKEDLKLLQLRAQDAGPAKDVEASQSENRKRVEFDEYTPMSRRRLHGGNLKSLSEINHPKNVVRNDKFTELSHLATSRMHGGNLKISNNRNGGRRNEQIDELDDDHDDDEPSHDDHYNASPQNARHDRLHGGNYRSAKLVIEKVKSPELEARRSATAMLNNFVQAVPVLTTTPSYILDPSKRMYYYVDV